MIMKKFMVTISTDTQEAIQYIINASTDVFAKIAALAQFTDIYDEGCIIDIRVEEVER
jgi:hypothetical protein